MLVIAAAFGGTGTAHAAGPGPISVTGVNGTGRITQPGLPCDQGGGGDFWHDGYEASLAPGAFTSLPTDVRMNLDVHGEHVGGLPPDAPNGFLQGTESTVALVNDRGTIVLRLSDGGSCAHRTARVSNTTATTAGVWSIGQGSGSYATIAGTGTFSVNAGIAPGADNPWSLALSSGLVVGQPSLQVVVVRTFWGNLGLDYLTRQPSVQVRITNTGAGDAFGVQLTGAPALTTGVSLVGGAPTALGDLSAGESIDVTLRYQLALLGGPCTVVILGCQFDFKVNTAMADALDVALTDSDQAHAVAPLLPPPL
jgi:hypothetical protein